MKRIAFICVHNSCRSQIAEALGKYLRGDEFEFHSAGTETKPQISGQPNPFENDTPTEIDDRPVEDYIGEGEDRPGEGIHF